MEVDKDTTILIIDDDKGILDVFSEIIYKYLPGCKVLTAETGKEGVKIASKFSVDTIVLDIGLPDIDGLELCEKLKNDVLTKHIPIILLTGKGDSYYARGIDSGADSFLSKPVPIDVLISQIKAMLRIKSIENGLVEKYKITEHMLKECIDSLPGLFYVFDKERFIVWNKHWNTVTEYSDEEISKKYGNDFFEDDDKTLIEARMEEVFVKGISEAEAKITTKSGKKIPYYFTGVKKMLTNKEHLIGLGVDITKRVKIEEAVNRSNIILTKLAEATNWIIQHDIRDISFEKLLKSFGILLEASRMHIYRREVNSNIHYDRIYYWCNPGFCYGIEDPRINFSISLDSTEWKSMVDAIDNGEVYVGKFSEVDAQEQSLYNIVGIKSVVLVPILNSDKSIYGFFGIDHISEREWTEGELSVLKMIGAVISTLVYKLQVTMEEEKHIEEATKNIKSLRRTLSDTLTLTDDKVKGMELYG